jgi:hypothetical protein
MAHALSFDLLPGPIRAASKLVGGEMKLESSYNRLIA